MIKTLSLFLIEFFRFNTFGIVIVKTVNKVCINYMSKALQLLQL